MGDFAGLVTALAGWLLLACGAWTVLLLAALACDTGTGGRLPALEWVGCPPGLRRALFLALGVALVCEVPASAGAADTAAGGPADASSVAAPERATGRLAERGPAQRGGPAQQVTVRPGDSLWTIAAATAAAPDGTSPTDRTVVRLVRQLHHTNRHVVGPDPDHIEPGQRLRVPWTTSRHKEQR